MTHKGIGTFDIVDVTTNPRQEGSRLATVLELTELHGEEAAVIQYHYNSCSPDTVAVRYMKPIHTPPSRWSVKGEQDPHGERYVNCERATLTHGSLTDDELANAVYLYPENISYLTAAKERIRWLSRQLHNLLNN